MVRQREGVTLPIPMAVAMRDRGVMTYANCDRYEGEFKAGRRNGRGVCTYADGHRYEGEIKADQKGRGVYILADGHRYEGDFKDGEVNS